MLALTATPVRPPAVLRAENGEALELDLGRWHDPATDEEVALLQGVNGPVIDLGCGPGRLVVHLMSQGVPALGVDSSPSAIALSRMKGASVRQRDIFGPLPQEGSWGTALLFDGNIGIGGDPVRLLSRCRQLIAVHGRVLAEVEPPGTHWRRLTVRVERLGRRSESFAWAVVGADSIAGLAGEAGLEVTDLAPTPSGRWFARLA